MPIRKSLIASAATATILLSAAAPLRREGDAARYRECLASVRATPGQAVSNAAAWRVDGGGVPARHCLALALLALNRFAESLAELEDAARDADTTHDPLAADLWGQAGNAALLAGDPARARSALTTAIVRAPASPARSGWLIDRARAEVAGGSLAAAQIDLDAAIALDPTDPVAGTLSVALAKRIAAAGKPAH